MRFPNALRDERLRMGEEVERLRGQVGALRREVWLSVVRRRDGAMELNAPSNLTANRAPSNGVTPSRVSSNGVSSGAGTTELVPRRLSGIPHFGGHTELDTTTKQIVKL
jgi:hypothetical protein